MRAFLIALVGVFWFTSAAVAQPPSCAPRAMFVEGLSKLKETQIATAVVWNGALLELWVSKEKTQKWTILITAKNGVTCLVTHGDGWRGVQMAGRGPHT